MGNLNHSHEQARRESTREAIGQVLVYAARHLDDLDHDGCDTRLGREAISHVKNLYEAASPSEHRDDLEVTQIKSKGDLEDFFRRANPTHIDYRNA